MARVTMEIIEPYERQGNDVIVKIRRSISGVGMPPRVESFFLRLKDHAHASDEQIGEAAMARIWEHLEKLPDEP